jgi:tryptophan synthase beta subunit
MRFCLNLRYYTIICPEKLSNSTRNLRQNFQRSARDSKRFLSNRSQKRYCLRQLSRFAYCNISNMVTTVRKVYLTRECTLPDGAFVTAEVPK